MKKQTEIVTTTASRTPVRKMELIFLVVIATVIYRNQSSRRLSGMPPNSFSLAKQGVQAVVSESEKMIGKLAGFFYNVTGDSLLVLLQFLAIAGLFVFMVAAIIYTIKTH